MASWDDLSPKERNALVAEKVMGWEWWVYKEHEGMAILLHPETSNDLKESSHYWPANEDDERFLESAHPYTSDIRAAWRVVEQMWEDDWQLEVAYSKPDETSLYFWIPEEYEKPMHTAMDTPSAAGAKAPTMPEAICLAALRAIEGDDDE